MQCQTERLTPQRPCTSERLQERAMPWIHQMTSALVRISDRRRPIESRQHPRISTSARLYLFFLVLADNFVEENLAKSEP